jgi:hypothetical protein
MMLPIPVCVLMPVLPDRTIAYYNGTGKKTAQKKGAMMAPSA